jgi:hypothetical protein
MLCVDLGGARPDTQWSSQISRLEFGANPGSRRSMHKSANRSRLYGTSGGLGTNTIVTIPQSHLEQKVDIEACHGTSDMGSSASRKEN